MADDDALWVESRRRSDRGDYAVGFKLGALTWSLDRRGAERYARAVIYVAQTAAHDAAVLGELTALGVGRDAAATFVVEDLRRRRPPYDDAATRPLVFSPAVTNDVEPLVVMRWGTAEDQAAQLTAAEATRHAIHVLETAAVVELDAAYFRGLTGELGLSPIRAASAVDDLARFRISAADGYVP